MLNVICTVDRAGASVGGGNTPDNAVFLILTDTNGSFQKGFFYAADTVKNQMLAVALAAISNGRQVFAVVDPPDNSNKPIPSECYELDIIVD